MCLCLSTPMMLFKKNPFKLNSHSDTALEVSCSRFSKLGSFYVALLEQQQLVYIINLSEVNHMKNSTESTGNITPRRKTDKRQVSSKMIWITEECERNYPPFGVINFNYLVFFAVFRRRFRGLLKLLLVLLSVEKDLSSICHFWIRITLGTWT